MHHSHSEPTHLNHPHHLHPHIPAFVDGRITIRTSIAKRAKKLLYVVSEALDQDGGTIAVLEGTWMIV